MERRIAEEEVTKTLISWLEGCGWEIISFDFPQSGTGRLLHPFYSTGKNEEGIIPDIIAFKKGIVIVFENKDRFVRGDFMKVNQMRNSGVYNQSIKSLLHGRAIKSIYYGIGIPLTFKNLQSITNSCRLVDFVVVLTTDGISLFYQTDNIY